MTTHVHLAISFVKKTGGKTVKWKIWKNKRGQEMAAITNTVKKVNAIHADDP